LLYNLPDWERPLTFRFVHSADIHLDSPLRSLALRDPALADLVGNSTRRSFAKIVDLCLDEQVDALLLSGDLYDGEQTSMKTARFLGEQLQKLHEANIKVFVIRGNHDAVSRITQELVLPESVTLFGGRASCVLVERERREIPIAIHGISFAQPHVPDSLLPRFKPPVEGAVNIGLLHTSINGSPMHDPYAPCAVADLHATGFRYWALGHIHQRAISDGTATVVMPGMPQGRDINEAGAKSVTLVTLSDDGSLLLEERITSIAQFERVTVDLSRAEDWGHMVRVLVHELEQVRSIVASEHLVARVNFVGTTSLAWRLRRDLDLLRTEAEHQAAILGKSWIDKVDVECRPPGNTPSATAATLTDPIDEMRGLMSDALDDDGYRAEIAAIGDELRGQLPAECRSMLGLDAQTFAAKLSDAARYGIDDVLARLKGGSGDEAS
jgi:DNA repair protein SbcD/Mre11